MRRLISALLLSAMALLPALPAAHAADKVKVGFVSTLSGPSAALGVDIRDGFLLALKLNGGKLGGLPAEVLVSDDQFKPDVAKQLFEQHIKRDKVDFMTGIVFSNIMLAGPAGSARRQDDLHQPERGAVVDSRQGVQPALLRRGLAERRLPRGRGPVREHARLEERRPDRAELSRPARTRSPASSAPTRARSSTRSTPSSASSTTRPSSPRSAPPSRRRVYIFLPGGMGINFIKQFVGAGLGKDTPLLLARLLGRRGRHQRGRRADGRALQHRALGARPRQRREPEVRRRLREGIQAPAVALRLAGLRRGAADRRRGARRQRQARGQGRRCARRSRRRSSTRCAATSSSTPTSIRSRTTTCATVGKDGKGGIINKSFNEPILKNHGDAYVAECKMK